LRDADFWEIPMTSPVPRLTPEQLEAFGREMDALRQRVIADLGERDATYIRTIIRVQRSLEVAGRGLLFVGFFRPAWLAGVAALSLSKILDNLEIGHNVMHGQYDWMRDPALTGKTFEWDTVCPADQWRYTHNYLHHTYTNIVGKDRDVGYGVLRVSEDQPWHPYYLGNPLYALAVAVVFQWGSMLHALEVERLVKGERTWAEIKPLARGMWQKAGRQVLRDYVLFPLLAGRSARRVRAGNSTADLVRNLWAFAIIFCGHFPDDVQTFSVAETENETRGGWYYRQLLGSANIDGGRLFHLLSGNLSFQIEHHLFPDLPASRYQEISVEVREICARYGLPYNTGPFHRQFGTVARKIVKLALPEWPRRGSGAPHPRDVSVAGPAASSGDTTSTMPGTPVAGRLDAVSEGRATPQCPRPVGAAWVWPTRDPASLAHTSWSLAGFRCAHTTSRSGSSSRSPRPRTT
jgi:fatty acid desaturase